MGAALNKALADARIPKTSSGLPQIIRMYLLHCVSRGLFYWLPNYILYLINRKGMCLQWKIQRNRNPKGRLAWEAVMHNAVNDFLPQLVVNAFFHKFLCTGDAWNVKMPKAAKTAEVNDHDTTKEKSISDQPGDAIEKPKGWAGLNFEGPPPKIWTSLWQIAVAYIGYDVMFYWSHRLMHHPRLYKHCHKIHHQFHTPIGPSASHEHIVEGLVQLFNWYIPIGFAGWLNRKHGGLHAATLFYYNSFRWIETVDAHCGYEFPFSPFHLLPFCGGARRHDYHHRAFDGCFGATTFWDYICGTDTGFWGEVAEEGGFMLAGSRSLT